ncbi:MAG: Gfo/Idh/MocA family protein [Anaerolineae bacterium]
MSTYRVGIVGLSAIAAAPAAAAPLEVFGTEAPHTHAPSYARVPETRVVAVCDLMPKLLEDFGVQWGGSWPGITAYTDYRQMLAQERLDILSVVTSDHRHADIVVNAVAAGIKGIYCEKPLATSLADADRMIAAVEGAGVPMVINHSRRWWPEYPYLRALLRGGELGRLSRVMAHTGYGRAMLFRNGTHLIDAINYFVEAEPQWVVGELDPEHAAYGPVYAGDGGRDPAMDPGATAMIRYRNGVVAFLSISKTTAIGWEIHLLCERGALHIGPGHITMDKSVGQPPELLRKELAVPHYACSGGVAAVRELIGLMEHGGVGQSTPHDGRRALEIILGILRSQHLGSARVDFPLIEEPQA